MALWKIGLFVFPRKDSSLFFQLKKALVFIQTNLVVLRIILSQLCSWKVVTLPGAQTWEREERIVGLVNQ